MQVVGAAGRRRRCCRSRRRRSPAGATRDVTISGGADALRRGDQRRRLRRRRDGESPDGRRRRRRRWPTSRSAPGAAIGFRDVTVQTGAEVARRDRAGAVARHGRAAGDPAADRREPERRRARIDRRRRAHRRRHGVRGRDVGGVGSRNRRAGALDDGDAARPSAVARLRIADDAPLGFRDLKVTTGAENAALLDGFEVTARGAAAGLGRRPPARRRRRVRRGRAEHVRGPRAAERRAAGGQAAASTSAHGRLQPARPRERPGLRGRDLGRGPGRARRGGDLAGGEPGAGAASWPRPAA